MDRLHWVRAVFWATVLASFAGTSWGGEILTTAESLPSNLKTPLGPQTKKEVFNKTPISCYNVSDGSLLDCAFVMKINGLSQRDTSADNTGGHSHDGGRDLGELRSGGAAGAQVKGQTANIAVVVEQRVPEVGGRIETQLDLFVPPGFVTVFPESFDATRTFWRFITTLNVNVPGLTVLPDMPTGAYRKVRSTDDDHKDAVAFFGTRDALIFLNAIAETYQLLTIRSDRPAGLKLSVNDMSLIQGGYFDLNLNWRGEERHINHRTGNSADINRDQVDCGKNKDLRAAVDITMPITSKSPIARRNPPTRLLCESGGRIHIDFDQVAPPALP